LFTLIPVTQCGGHVDVVPDLGPRRERTDLRAEQVVQIHDRSHIEKHGRMRAGQPRQRNAHLVTALVDRKLFERIVHAVKEVWQLRFVGIRHYHQTRPGERLSNLLESGAHTTIDIREQIEVLRRSANETVGNQCLTTAKCEAVLARRRERELRNLVMKRVTESRHAEPRIGRG
jgi:hypothetical protein